MYALIHKLQKKTKNDRHFAVGSPAIIWQIIFFYLPLCLMLLSSIFLFSDSGALQGLSFQNFIPVFSWAHFSIIYNSIALALFTAILSLLIAYPLAHFIAFQGGAL